MSALDEVEGETQEFEARRPDADERPATPFDALRALHAEKRDEAHKDIAVPGFKGLLVCRYRAVPVAQERKIAARMAQAPQEDDRREMNFYADELIAGCEQFLYRARQGERLEPLHPTEPIRYDPQLASGMELIAPSPEGFTSARAVLFALFTRGAEGDADLADQRVMAHHDEYQAWLRGAGEMLGQLAGADERFAGE